MLSSKSPPKASSPWYPDLPLDFPRDRRKGSCPQLQPQWFLFSLFYILEFPLRFHLGKEKKSSKKQTKKSQVQTPLTGSSLLPYFICQDVEDQSLSAAAAWHCSDCTGQRRAPDICERVSQWAHGHTSSLDKGKVNTQAFQRLVFHRPLAGEASQL